MLWTLLAYVAAIVTNLILFSGVLALVYWIGEKQSGWMKRFHDILQYGSCWLFLLYLVMMALVDGHQAPHFTGDHWTYFNLLIIAGFVFNLLMVSWIYWLGSVALIVGYLWFVVGMPTPLQLALTVIGAGVAGLLALRGSRLWAKRWVIYPLMAVYGIATMAVLANSASPKPPEFWLRQVSSLIIEFVICYEYARMLVKLRIMNNRYREEAVRDRMTGLKNFGTFNTELQALYHKHHQAPGGFWLLELDVDHFKHINDTYGHLVGNTVLETVAKETRAFAATLPDETAVYRMGGEEFCLLVHSDCQDQQEAAQIAQRLRKRLSALPFHGEHGESFTITVSLGATQAQASDEHYLDIYNRVDQYLYAAKHAGRDGLNINGQLAK
ncbi:GGDEF domain-containing protein [Lacticaseibacillus jixiensis]|uniref:GGDEF domain-containing protein n=1 Tax=Lacticaseibacillus jixiensis TaxID=3231926 RepID=UPI0036F2CD96